MTRTLKVLATILTALAGLTGASAKTLTPDTISATRAFISLPQSVCPVLNEDNRLTMVDYFRAGMDKHTENFLNGESWLTALTDNYAEARLTEVSRLQIRTLPLSKGGQIVAVSYTVANDDVAPDSELFFFDAQMNLIETKKIIKLPVLENFFTIPRGSLTSMKEIRQMIPFITIEYTLSADSTTLTARLTLGENIDRDDLKIIKLFLHDTVSYRWDGSRYRLIKR